MSDVRHGLYLIDAGVESETVGQMASSACDDMVVLDFTPSQANNARYSVADVVAACTIAPTHAGQPPLST